MDDNSQAGNLVKWGAGALGLSAVVAAVASPKLGIWIALILLIILVLALVLFGGYYVWSRLRAKRQREQFSSAIQAQTAEAPKSISDPNKRAALDRVRQKFQSGLQEFKSRGKDIYKLPWYVIIGESGSGKTEAIRHSGIDFPPSLQDELQGAGGTVNMDWWFTNRGIILDTAGSMIFNEARAGETPEWREFLRLLKKARSRSPINGLFLVLSIESLIRDSADRIAQKAGILAQQLDLIQRTLDVRFPVYLLVTKSDLLTGFREFFDNVEDPLLQHQMFGWSNPDPLDAAFRPDLVEQHLENVAERVRRRRLALLRDAFTARQPFGGDTQRFFAASSQAGFGGGPRRLDEVDKMFALPESILRLAPRLRRYLETIFVAGEWSAKPVFLRGIYFTSSMREGKALDEAIAYATGLPLEQLPEDRSWDKNRAYFLRDLFHEKVFRESGLVTRATNTLKLLRKRQFAIFGTAAVALLVLTVFSFFAYRDLKESVLRESAYWQVGAANWSDGRWNPAIVASQTNSSRSLYAGTNQVTTVSGMENLTLIQYHSHLGQIAQRKLAVNWIFKPLAMFDTGDVQKRAQAQRHLFDAGVLAPLVLDTKAKMIGGDLAAGELNLSRHRAALLSLMELEADARLSSDQALVTTNTAAGYLKSFLDYLTETDLNPDASLVRTFVGTYDRKSAADKGSVWPPAYLLGGDALANNIAIQVGLENFQKECTAAQTNLQQHLKLVNDFADKLRQYHGQEVNWLANLPENCTDALAPAKLSVDASWTRLAASTNFGSDVLTNLSSRYQLMADTAASSSASTLKAPVRNMLNRLPLSEQKRRLFNQILARLDEMAGQAADAIVTSRNQRASALALLDANCLAATNGSLPAYQARWQVYANACALASTPLKLDESLIGDKWARFGDLKKKADAFRAALADYQGPLAVNVSNTCSQIAAQARERLEGQYVESYVKLAAGKLAALANQPQDTLETITNTRIWLARIEGDLQADAVVGGQMDKLSAVAVNVREARQKSLTSIGAEIKRRVGFPVLLDASSVMDIQSMQTLRGLLTGLRTELQDPVWQADKTGALNGLQAKCDHYASVVTSLVDGQGSPGQWELWFVPPESTDEADKEIVRICRDAQVTVGDQPGEWADLAVQAHADQLAAKAGADAGLKLNIRCLRDDPTSEVFKRNFSDWGLVRLIKDSELKAERLDEGSRWRFTVKLGLNRQGWHKGNEVFEVKLLSGRLPKIEEWPTQ